MRKRKTASSDHRHPEVDDLSGKHSKYQRQAEELKRLRDLTTYAPEEESIGPTHQPDEPGENTRAEPIVRFDESDQAQNQPNHIWAKPIVDTFLAGGRLRLRELAIVVLIGGAGWIAFQDNSEDRLSTREGLITWANKIIAFTIVVVAVIVVYKILIAIEEWWQMKNISRRESGLRWLVKLGPLRLTTHQFQCSVCFLFGALICWLAIFLVTR